MIWLSGHLTYHLIISDNTTWKRLQKFYSQIKQNSLKTLGQPIWQPPPLQFGIHSCLQCDFQSLVNSVFLENIIVFSSCSKDKVYPTSRSRVTILSPVISYPLQRTLQRPSMITQPVIPNRKIPFSPLDTYEYEYHISVEMEILIPSAASVTIIFLILSSPHDCISLTRDKTGCTFLDDQLVRYLHCSTFGTLLQECGSKTGQEFQSCDFSDQTCTNVSGHV